MNIDTLGKFFPPEKPAFYLCLSFLLGAVVLCVYLFCSVNIYRDTAFCYAFAVQEAAKYGNWDFVLDPGLPVLNMVLGVPFAKIGLEPFQALFLVGGLFWICTLFPLYALLKRFVSPLTASFGCLLYILTPKLMRFSCSGLLESSRNFFFLAALLLLFQLSDRKTAGHLLLFSLSLAGLALSRAEGCIISAFFLLSLLLLDLWNMRKSLSGRKILHSVLCCFLSGLLLLLFLAPKLIYNYRKTGYPTPDTRFNPYLNAIFHLDKYLVPPPDFPQVLDLAHSSAAHSGTAGFDWSGNTGAVFSGLFRGAYELYAVFALAGLVLIVSRWKRPWIAVNAAPPAIITEGWRREYTVMVFMILLHCAIYFSDCSAYRYYTFAVPVVLLWALAFLEWLYCAALRLPRRMHVPLWIAGAMLLVAVLQLSNGISFAFQDRENREIGLFLQTHQNDFLKPGKKRVRVYNLATEICCFSGFEYVNTSLNSKSRALQEKENDFDILVCTVPCGELSAVQKKYPLTEWKNHPYSGKIRIFVRKSDIEEKRK